MVDAGWYGTSQAAPFKTRSLRDWIRLARALEELDIIWLEDFIHPENSLATARSQLSARRSGLPPASNTPATLILRA